MKVLVFGLPGSGKGDVAKYLSEQIRGVHLDVCAIRTNMNDWSMSIQSRIKVNEHLKSAALGAESCDKIVIMESLAEFPDIRRDLNPDYIVWVDTISECTYDDTNLFFQQPIEDMEHIDYKITDINDSEALDDLVSNVRQAIREYKIDRK